MIVFFSAQTFLEQAHKRWTLLEEQQSNSLACLEWHIGGFWSLLLLVLVLVCWDCWGQQRSWGFLPPPIDYVESLTSISKNKTVVMVKVKTVDLNWAWNNFLIGFFSLGTNTKILNFEHSEHWMSEHRTFLTQNWTSNMLNITKNWTVHEHQIVSSKTSLVT